MFNMVSSDFDESSGLVLLTFIKRGRDMVSILGD